MALSRPIMAKLNAAGGPQRGGDFEAFRKTEEELKRIPNKTLRQFYEAQNEQLDLYAEGE